MFKYRFLILTSLFIFISSSEEFKERLKTSSKGTLNPPRAGKKSQSQDKQTLVKLICSLDLLSGLDPQSPCDLHLKKERI